MKIETYQEEWTYKWVKTKRFEDEMIAFNKLENVLPAEWYAKNTLIYIIDEKQVYRAKHTKRLKYIGLTNKEKI